MKNKILIIGAGGHARSCVDVIENATKKYEILGFVEKKILKKKTQSKYKIIALEKDLLKIFKKNYFAHIGFGRLDQLKLRSKLFKKLKKLKFNLPVIKSKHAYVSSNSKIDEGTIIMHGTAVNFGAKIGKNCILNSNVTIEHDVIIGSHCHIAPGAVINGGVKIEDYSFVGSGAVIKENIKVSKNCVIGANTFLRKNLTKKKYIG